MGPGGPNPKPRIRFPPTKKPGVDLCDYNQLWWHRHDHDHDLIIKIIMIIMFIIIIIFMLIMRNLLPVRQAASFAVLCFACSGTKPEIQGWSSYTYLI